MQLPCMNNFDQKYIYMNMHLHDEFAVTALKLTISSLSFSRRSFPLGLTPHEEDKVDLFDSLSSSR